MILSGQSIQSRDFIRQLTGVTLSVSTQVDALPEVVCNSVSGAFRFPVEYSMPPYKLGHLQTDVIIQV